MYHFYFEKMRVWQKACDLAVDIYKITKEFPKSEKFILVDQIQRSAVSVMANISEGNTRETRKEQARFTTIAYSSLMELLNHLIVSKRLDFLSENEYEEVRERIEHIANMLNALRKKQKSLE